ncbi:MAG TPA: hypothetical protein VFV51_11990 [Vicinamibacterales bacterium]|nr:hypothetical protein [Vicinamibacterales bacterium]
MRPDWLALFAPLPDDVVIERKPVASPELVASGRAEAIAGWDSITVNLSDIAHGMRHVLITLDSSGRLISGGDGVMFHREERRGDETWQIYDHENLGGRFEADGSFLGTRWQTHVEQRGDEDEDAVRQSNSSAPAPDDVARLRALVAWVLERAPVKPR